MAIFDCSIMNDLTLKCNVVSCAMCSDSNFSGSMLTISDLLETASENLIQQMFQMWAGVLNFKVTILDSCLNSNHGPVIIK